MKRLRYFAALLLVLLLGAALPWAAGAETLGWSFDDGGGDQGVTLTVQGDELTVTLDLQKGEYTIWLVTEKLDFENPIYMTQHAGTGSFPVILTESKLKEIRDQELALCVYGTELELMFDVRYGALKDTPAPTPSPPSTPSPSLTPTPTPSPSQSGGSDDDWTPPPPTPTPTPAPALTPELQQFTDTVGHWGETYISEAAARRLFSGYGDGRFGPDDPMTRAQFVTVLWRMAGRPGGEEETPFTDIGGESAEFRGAIAWAYHMGYVNGISEDRFSPSGLLTREQAMKILFYFAGGVSGDEAELYDVYDRGYADSAAISSWAKEPMYWGVYNRIIAGVGDGRLDPQGTATRAQLAKILIVYLEDAA